MSIYCNYNTVILHIHYGSYGITHEDALVQETSAGTVTVVKVKSVDPQGLVFEFNDAGAISESPAAFAVAVPATVAEQASAGTNLLVSLTQVAEDVS